MEWVQCLLGESMDNRPIFIVGMNGSGTTMLNDCLGNHPNLYAFPRETRILPYYINNMHKYGDLNNLANRRKLSRDLGNAFAFRKANGNKQVVLNDQDLSKPGFANVVDSLYTYFSKPKGKIRWVDKSPMYVNHIGLLANFFPNAKFIHIYRDGREVAQSFHRRWKKNPAHSIFKWKKVIQQGHRDGLRLGTKRYIEIKYENLTHRPEYTMKLLCRFLDIDFYPVMLISKGSQMEDSIKTNKIVENSGKWKTYFSSSTIKKLENIAGKQLEKLGYNPSSIYSDYDPPLLQLKYWALLNNINMTIIIFQKGGFSILPNYLRRVLAALRQTKTNPY